VAAGWLRDTGGLYARAFRRGAQLALRNWPVGLVVIFYGTLLSIVARVAAPLGLAGGLLLYLVTVACFSSWLSLVEQVIRVGRVRLQDLPGGFLAYLGDLLTVFFLLWGLRLVASLVLAPFPFLGIVFGLAVLAFFNAVPELIYLGRHSAAELLVESYRFIGENWIEWFPANLLLAACIAVTLLLPAGPFGIVSGAGAGLAFYFAMIVRGLLFLELASSSRRAREFRRRAAG
jgi:hypothetical protein